MTGVYDRAIPAAEEAEHSHDIPIHKPFSLSYTYAQTGSDLENPF